MKKNILPVSVAVLLLAGGAWGFARVKQESEHSLPPGAKAGDLTLEPCTYKSKTRTYQAECGTLLMPEVPEKTGSRLISLPVNTPFRWAFTIR